MVAAGLACSVAPTVVTPPPGALSPSGEAPDTISCAHALVITGSSEQDGVNAEYAWINAHYPGHSRPGQALVIGDKRYYDVLTFRTAEGHDASVCFDFTAVRTVF